MRIAVLIPCYNEAVTIGKVIGDVKKELPQACIYVYDNNSTDNTAAIAASMGVRVVKERRQGKGNVVRAMFKNIEADVYVLIDGDDACPANSIHDLMQPILKNEADMVIGERMSNGRYAEKNTRAFHGWGNGLVIWLINFLFRSNLTDIMAGYRAFNRYYVKTLPVLSRGFEIETEMTIYALHNNYRVTEVPIAYRDRPQGSFSKLNTYKDGFKVLRVIFMLFKDCRPLLFFSLCSLLMVITGLFIGIPPVIEFLEGGYVYRVPSVIIAAALVIIAILLFACGLILDTTVQHKRALNEQLSTLYKVIEKAHVPESIQFTR